MTKKHLILLNGLVLLLLFYLFSHQNSSTSANNHIFGQIIVYNRVRTIKNDEIDLLQVPKTASTTLTNAVAYDLFKQNGFNVIHVNITKNRQVLWATCVEKTRIQILSLGDQFEFVSNVTSWRDRLPAFYHGHMAFVDFTR